MKRLLGPEIITFLLFLLSYILINNVCIVYDGDTFRKGLYVYRIIGIDAPEYKKKQKEWVIEFISNILNVPERKINISCLNLYGIKAKEELEKQINFFCFNIKVIPVKKDKYGRILAYVYKDTTDIGEELIIKGFAIVYPFEEFEKKEEYYKAMYYAIKNKEGLWGCIIK